MNEQEPPKKIFTKRTMLRTWIQAFNVGSQIQASCEKVSLRPDGISTRAYTNPRTSLLNFVTRLPQQPR